MVDSLPKEKDTSTLEIDASGLHYRVLNAKLREAVSRGVRKIGLKNVCGQRYIGTDLDKPVEIEIFGTAGNDLGAFMDGPRLTVHGNAQDGCGNTMNNGDIVIHGHAGDVIALSARGGKIFVRDDVGYRAGIHMKEYEGKRPVLVIGGTAQDFLGEYMAGGVMIVLGLHLREGQPHPANFIGTGMHGGVIYLRGTVEDFQLGKEVGMAELDEKDYKAIREHLADFAARFHYDLDELAKGRFIKLYPRWLRPYGQLYAY